MKYFLLVMALLTGCASQKGSTDITVVQAEWRNWVGGRAGVGGVKYDVSVLVREAATIRLDSLVVDGVSFPAGKPSVSGDTLSIMVNDNRSVAGTRTINQPTQETLTLRKADPETAYIVFSFDGSNQRLYISTFKQTDTEFFR